MLKCSTCGEEKDESCFYKDNSFKRGYSYRCKDCVRLSRQTPEMRAHLAAKQRARYHADPMADYKRECSSLVSKAVKAGVIDKLDACEHCGSEEKLYGHHDDYLKPLDVVWLCGPCHKIADKERRKLEQAMESQG